MYFLVTVTTTCLDKCGDKKESFKRLLLSKDEIYSKVSQNAYYHNSDNPIEDDLVDENYLYDMCAYSFLCKEITQETYNNYKVIIKNYENIINNNNN